MRLLRYGLRRLLFVVPVLAAALFLTFALTRIVPGNPIDRVAGPYISNEQRAHLKHQAYLDRPFYTQFALYVRDLVHGRMGVSYTTAQDVSKDLRQRFPASFELVTYAMLIAILSAVPLGIAAAIKKDSWIDHVARVVSVSGVSMPIFWLGLILLYGFFYKLNWLPGPVGRTGSASTNIHKITGILTLDTLIKGDFAAFWEVVKALVLPCVTLGFVAMAPIARFTRATMAEVLGILTITAAVYGYALGGEVLVEIIFNWPGLRQYSYNAILASDFPAIQGFVLLVTFVYMVIYLLLDLATAALDPRVKY